MNLLFKSMFFKTFRGRMISLALHIKLSMFVLHSKDPKLFIPMLTLHHAILYFIFILTPDMKYVNAFSLNYNKLCVSANRRSQLALLDYICSIAAFQHSHGGDISFLPRAG